MKLEISSSLLLTRKFFFGVSEDKISPKMPRLQAAKTLKAQLNETPSVAGDVCATANLGTNRLFPSPAPLSLDLRSNQAFIFSCIPGRWKKDNIRGIN